MSRICSIIKRLKQPFERKPSRRCHYNKRGVAKRGFRSKDEAEAFIEAKGLKGYGAYRCKVCEMWHVGKLRIKKISRVTDRGNEIIRNIAKENDLW